MFSSDLFDVLDETSKKKSINVLDGKKVKVEEINHKRFSTSEADDNEDKKLKVDLVQGMTSMSEDIPRFDIHHVHTTESCLHEVAVPRGTPYIPLSSDPSKPPAKEYPFTLDAFQTEAISCLENNRSVLVSAHTSAGKTVVAEYAVALSLKARQRVIYTTPIKALSNQKYRELLAEFVDVGLMTGDVTINLSASCLVMTTEILRSMLYRGSEMMREAAWVIFDEIHYMRDKDRGVVWEESIILLPDHIHYVFLSATIPNAPQFAEWIAHVHKQPCHVVYTEYRPTPLQHYIYPAGGDGIHLVLDENRNFKEDNFNTAMSVLRNAGEAAKGDQRGRNGGVVGESNVFKIVRMVMEKNLAPVIIFSFSKKECEEHARTISKLDFNDDDKKEMVREIFNNALLTLSEEDRKLPKLQQMLPLLVRGIGIHHSGLLPLTKEVIEILFSAGLIKVLCATETFAMGLNMPARTVLFTSAQKFDGKEFRWISSGEYIQMSGRAGRRGLDDKGIVILMLDEKISPGIGKQILKGKPDPLNSAFHLTYTMILNMLRVEGIEPESMLERSFLQFQNFSHLPDLLSSLRGKEAELSKVDVGVEVASYCRLKQQLLHTTTLMLPYIQRPEHLLPFLKPGRLIKVGSKGVDYNWAVVHDLKRVNQPKKMYKPEHMIEAFLHVDSDSSRYKDFDDVTPCPANQKGHFQVVLLKLQTVQLLSSVRLKMVSNPTSHDARFALLSMLKAVKDKFQGELPLLDPVDDLGVKEPAFAALAQRAQEMTSRLQGHEVHGRSDLGTLMQEYQAKEHLETDVKNIRQELRLKRNLLQMDQLRRMKRVLRRLAYTSAADVVQIKGRVACEISSADVLVLSELLFNGTFSKLTATEVCSLVSCFTFQEKATSTLKLDDSLKAAFKQLKEVARGVGRVGVEVGLQVDEQEYVDSFQPHLMAVVQAWCAGAPFVQVCQMTSIFEGSIIRSIRRLEECLRQMCQAAKVMGNADLEIKFAEGIRLIKRDIVFAASLYL